MKAKGLELKIIYMDIKLLLPLENIGISGHVG
jgi:hypothetical protein